MIWQDHTFWFFLYIKKIPRSVGNSSAHFRKKGKEPIRYVKLGKPPKISGQATTFRRAMLAHLQGISPSAGGTPCQFKKKCFWQKILACFSSVSVLLFGLVEKLCFSRMQDFFIPCLIWKLVISYSYFSIDKIIVLAFLHTLKIIHSWAKVVIKFTGTTWFWLLP